MSVMRSFGLGLLFGLLTACGGGSSGTGPTASGNTVVSAGQVGSTAENSNGNGIAPAIAQTGSAPPAPAASPAVTPQPEPAPPVSAAPAPAPITPPAPTTPPQDSDPPASGSSESGGTAGSAAAITYLHVLSTGQSLSVGEQSFPLLSVDQPYENLMLSPGVQGVDGPLRPLSEINGASSPQESPSSGLANHLRASDVQRRPVIVTLHGDGGRLYSELRKGGYGPWYAKGMRQAATVKALLEAQGHRYQPIAVTAVHGEADQNVFAGVGYEDHLREWQSDYEADIAALTGMWRRLPLFINQMNSAATGEVATAQYRAHRNNPGRIVLVGPKYQYNYVDDRLHLSNVQSKHVGEMLAKVIQQVMLEERAWNPLMPTRIRRTGRSITIDFHIPVGTLQIDTSTVAARPNFGFDFVQDGGSRAVLIDSVAIIDGGRGLRIDLNAVPDGSNQRIRYAWRCYRPGHLYACGRASEASHVGGNVRDSDARVSPAIGSTGLPLHNWLVAFEEPVVSP